WPQRCAGRRVVGGGAAGGATAACGRGADAGRAGRLRAGAACSGSSTTCGNTASARGTGVDCRREVGGGAGAGGSGDAGGTGEGTGCGGVSPMKSTRVTLPADAPCGAVMVTGGASSASSRQARCSSALRSAAIQG